jgi:hypothetical protein
MTKPSATLASGEMLSTAYLREPVKALLSAREDGLGEAMLLHILRNEDMHCLRQSAAAYAVTPDDAWLRKVRQTCKLLGATRDGRGVWRIPDSRKRKAA